MKETRMNRLAWHEYQHPVQGDESVTFLPVNCAMPRR
jgi:hypothetical protein